MRPGPGDGPAPAPGPSAAAPGPGAGGEPGSGPGVPAAPGDPPETWTFEQLMDALEGLTARLASGELGIEAAADLYEQAERLHHLASERLAQVQARVERLSPPPPPR